MRKQFIFDPQKETATAYLTRMSPILGALRNDGASVANQQLVSSIGSEEQKEIENEMCKAFEKTICTETRRVIKMTPGKLDDYEDDYKNELRIDILKEIHKFNNPAYRAMEKGLYTESTETEKLEEIYELVRCLTNDTIFMNEHASNLFHVRCRIPEQKEELLAYIKQFMESHDEKQLRRYREQITRAF